MKVRSIAVALSVSCALCPATFSTALGAAPKMNICIRSYQVDRTKAPNDRTLLFYMKDGSAYQSTLSTACPELSIYGFSYMPTPPDQICGNLQSIRVIHTGSVCMLGPLVPVGPKAGAAQ